MLTLVACYYAYYFLWLFNFWDEDCYLAVRIWTQNETTAMNPVLLLLLFFYIDIPFLRIDTVSPNKISWYSRVLIFSYTPIHFVVSDERISQRIQSASAHGDETACYIDDSSECLWLVHAFVSLTESYLIGYNAQCFKNFRVSGSVPASERRFEFSSWWCFSFYIHIVYRTNCAFHPK